MKNVFDILRAQPEPETEPISQSSPVELLQAWSPSRQLTPQARPGQTGYTHKGLGECPVCGNVGTHVKLPGDINVAFCQAHNVSLPVPPDFFD